MSNDDIAPAFVHSGTAAELQAEISRVFEQVVALLQSGELPKTGAAVVGIVNAAAFLCAHSPLPADPRAWQRMCKSAFEKFQTLLGRHDAPKDDRQVLLDLAREQTGILYGQGYEIASTTMQRLIDDVIRLQAELDLHRS